MLIFMWSSDWKTRQPWTVEHKPVGYVSTHRHNKMKLLFVGPLLIVLAQRNGIHIGVGNTND